MKRKVLNAIAAACVLIFVSAGCITSHNTQNMVDISKVDFNQEMTQGSSCQFALLFLIPFGRASVIAAARHEKIREVKLVEYVFKLTPIGSFDCVYVWGTTASDESGGEK